MTAISSPYSSIEEAIRGEQARWSVPGVAVGILDRGRTRFYASGTINVATGYPVATGSLFQIGSITKVFVATLAMRLAEAGKLDLDAPIATYIPDLTLIEPDLPGKLTIRHFLSHMSGLLGDHFPDEGWGDDAIPRAVAGLGKLPLVTPPGFAWSYCNIGFVIVGRAIELVTGKTFERAMEDEVWKPLKLAPITMFPDEVLLHSAAAGHNLDDATGEQVIGRPYRIARSSNPAGGIVTSTANLLKFAAFHMGDGTVDGERVLARESLDRMQTVEAHVSDVRDWGLGWEISRVAGVRRIGHGGSTNGHRALLAILPEREFAIALLTNGNRGNVVNREVAKWVFANELGLVAPDPAPYELSEAELGRLLGTYRSPLIRTAIADADGRLNATVTEFDAYTGKEGSTQVYPLGAIGPRALVVLDGPMKSERIDFLENRDDPAGPIEFARVALRLSKREDARS